MAELPLRLSLLFLLLFPVGDPVVRASTQVLAVAGILHSGVLRSPWPWALLFALTGWRALAPWPLSDNHAYLLVYWCLAVGLAQLTPEPDRALARSARLLTVLVFVFAVLWKLVLADDFLDGTFFRVLLLGDRRFEDWTLLVGGLDRDTLEATRRFVELGTMGGATAPELPRSFHALALALTWGSLGLEAAVALLFAAPLRGRALWPRHTVLIGFCAATYAVAPVAGFGWLLLVMGMAQCPADARRLRVAYLAALALMIVHDQVRWAPVMKGLVGS